MTPRVMLVVMLFAAVQSHGQTVNVYRGDVAGTVAGLSVTATVEIEVDGTPAVGATNRARARLLSDPGPFAVSTNWSRWQRATIGGKPAVFAIDRSGLRGSLTVDWFATAIGVEANGTAAGLAVSLPFHAVPLVGTRTNAPNVTTGNVAQSSTILRRVYKAGSDIGWEGEVPASWPRKTAEGKTLNAITCINGRKFDFASVGQKRKTLANLYGAEYGQPIRRGDTVYFSLKDLNGRNETPRLPIVWDWDPTVK